MFQHLLFIIRTKIHIKEAAKTWSLESNNHLNASSHLIQASMHANTTHCKCATVWCSNLQSKHASLFYLYSHNSSKPRQHIRTLPIPIPMEWKVLSCYSRYRWTTCADALSIRLNDAKCLFVCSLFKMNCLHKWFMGASCFLSQVVVHHRFKCLFIRNLNFIDFSMGFMDVCVAFRAFTTIN